MNSITWPMCLTLSTWQKVAPLTILLSTSSSSPIFIILASLNALVGGLGGLNQSQIRPLLAYSSIGHIGWILGVSVFSPWVRALYFSFYLTHSLILFSYFWVFNITSLKNFSTSTNYNFSTLIIISFLLLSLGGLPPLAGFVPKWIAISLFSSPAMPTLLIIGSLMNIFYYLNITLAALLSKNNRFSSSSIHPLLFPVFFTLTTSILILFL